MPNNLPEFSKPAARQVPYNPISLHYLKTFGEKVHKIPVSVAKTCPNREGLNGMKTCNFCDVWGSAAYEDLVNKSLHEQIKVGRERVQRRVNRSNFLVYFQAYTTTFARVAELRVHIAAALAEPDIKGFVVGTRPDCLSDALLDLLNEYSEKCYVAVELGVQSFKEDQLIWMRRGHTAERSIWGIRRLHEKTKVNLGVHLIFGLPGETEVDIIEAARLCNELPLDNVKLHNLHVLKNTPLADDFNRGEYLPISLEDYASRVTVFLQHLRPDIYIHRLAAVASRGDEIVAPKWAGLRMQTHQYILDYINARGARQGDRYVVN